jgi:hypothetical protein
MNSLLIFMAGMGARDFGAFIKQLLHPEAKGGKATGAQKDAAANPAQANPAAMLQRLAQLRGGGAAAPGAPMPNAMPMMPGR